MHRYIIWEEHLEKLRTLIRSAESVCDRHRRRELGMCPDDSASINRLNDDVGYAKFLLDGLQPLEPPELLQPIMPVKESI